jgi:hypothetical protein
VLSQLLPSIIRTVVPMLVALVTSWLVKLGIDPGPYQDLLSQLAGGLVATLYYVAVRFFETHIKPKFGWLLGYAKQPTYDAPAAPSETSPTGYEATPDAPADIPVGEAVEVTEAAPGSVTEGINDILGEALQGDPLDGPNEDYEPRH